MCVYHLRRWRMEPTVETFEVRVMDVELAVDVQIYSVKEWAIERVWDAYENDVKQDLYSLLDNGVIHELENEVAREVVEFCLTRRSA
jgi:hypothetical protein